MNLEGFYEHRSPFAHERKRDLDRQGLIIFGGESRDTTVGQYESTGSSTGRSPGLHNPPSAAISRAWAFVPGMAPRQNPSAIPSFRRRLLTVLRKRARAQLVGLARTIYRSPRKYAEYRRLPRGETMSKGFRACKGGTLQSKFFIGGRSSRIFFFSLGYRRRYTIFVNRVETVLENY